MSCISHDGHCHEENEGNEKEEKKEKIEKILFIISAFSFVLPVNNYIKIGMYVATILLAGYEIIVEGILNIFKLNFEEDTLMTIAVIAAFAFEKFSSSGAIASAMLTAYLDTASISATFSCCPYGF